jgi:hypothetical protein
MGVRAPLFVAVLAAAVLGVGAASASAVTLFSTTAHTVRVSNGAVGDATSVAPLDFTTTAGVLIQRCTHSNLALVVRDNGAASGVVAMTVTGIAIAPGCVGTLGQPSGTHFPPWVFTVTGHSTMIGTQTDWVGTLHNIALDTPTLGLYTGNLTTGVTFTQPTVATSPICIDFNAAGTLRSQFAAPMLIDAKYCLTGASAGWSLTDT